MMIPLVLFSYGLLSSPMFYLSSYLERHRDEYYQRLYHITASGQWDEWVQFFLTAIFEQAKENITRARSILALYDQMKVRLPKIVASQFNLQTIDTLFDRPIFKTTDFIERSKIPKPSAVRILRELQKQGVLSVVRESRGRRAAILMFRELISLAEGKPI